MLIPCLVYKNTFREQKCFYAEEMTGGAAGEGVLE